MERSRVQPFKIWFRNMQSTWFIYLSWHGILIRMLPFRVLEKVASELNPLAESQSHWLRASLAADTEGERIKDAIKEMDEAFNRFTVSSILY
jgi:hypothetical protein